MSKHVDNYHKARGIYKGEFIPCEVCGAIAVDIHHVLFKSQGGTDDIENLVALCRYDHDVAHGKIHGVQLTKEALFDIRIER